MIKKINIMPVAGKGQRFINQNYTIPKPFIKINNQYMFIKAAKSLRSFSQLNLNDELFINACDLLIKKKIIFIFLCHL